MPEPIIIPDRRINLANTELSVTRVALIVVFLLGVGWTFVSTVVIPINNMQIQLTQIQVSLKQVSQNYTALQAQETLDQSNILLIQQQLNKK